MNISYTVLIYSKRKSACLLRSFAKCRRNNGTYMFSLWGYSFHSGSSCQLVGKPNLDVYHRKICQLLLQVTFHILFWSAGWTPPLSFSVPCQPMSWFGWNCQHSQTSCHLSSRRYCQFPRHDVCQCAAQGNLYFLYIVKEKQSQFLIETIWVKCVLKGAVCLVSMKLLGYLQHGIQIGAKPVIANVSDIMLRPLGVPNVPTSVFLQGGNLNWVCINLVRLNAHRV